MAAAALDRLVQDNSPFAVTRALVSGREQTVFRHGAASLPEIYRKAFQANGRTILITDDTDLTLRDLSRRAGAYQRLLVDRGIGSGARVAIALENDAEWIAAFVALTSLGATAVLTDVTCLTRQAGVAACDIAVTDRQLETKLDSIICPDQCRSAGDALPAFLALDPDQDACIAFTSGSSGDSKGIILTHRGITTGLMNMMLAGAAAARTQSPARAKTARPAPTALLRTPLIHVSGYMQLLLMLMTGGRILRSRQDTICPLIARHQVTSVIGISDEEIAMLLDTGAEALHPLRSIAVAGRNLPARLRRAVRERLPDLGLGAGYGLTETNGLISAIGNTELDTRPHAVGPLPPTVQCRITAEDGRNCETGESGVIRLSGAMLMRGYCHGSGLEDGWFVTGDVGYLSQDGYLHVLDKEHRFLRDGERRISCREIEEAARAVTGITDIAALVRSGEAGEELMIVAATGAENLAHLREVIARHIPASIAVKAKFVATNRLPRTASGKIAYARLADDMPI
jgi:acyl-CoA synthetase (AMP-forming)/AMP-acid ligase II